MPDIGIVTPSFNQGEFIGRTVSSVLSQDFPVDYLVRDACSSDGSPNVLRQFPSGSFRFIEEEDAGQADALQKGFGEIGGDVVAYLNSDDILLPGTLEFVSRYFAENPHVDGIYSHRVFIDEHDKVTGFWVLPPHSDYTMRRWPYVPQETCFWRRELMESVGGIDPSYQFAMDYDLFARMMKQGRFRRVNRPTACFRVHGGSKTSTMLESLGMNEIERVRERYSIRLSMLDNFFGEAFIGLIEGASAIASSQLGHRLARKFESQIKKAYSL